jgi:hypothetical protein
MVQTVANAAALKAALVTALGTDFAFLRVQGASGTYWVTPSQTDDAFVATLSNTTITAYSGMGSFTDVFSAGSAFGTWNPLDATAGVTLASGNLEATLSSGNGVRGQTSHTTGKWYYEAMQASAGNVIIGFATASQVLGGPYGSNHTAVWYNPAVGSNVWGNNGWRVFGGTVVTVGAWFGMAVDLDAGLFWRRNAAGWDGDPAAGTGGYTIANFAGLAIFPYLITEAPSAVGLANFGASAFAYTAPSGFPAWG